jgi:2-aminoadipate transaminase
VGLPAAVDVDELFTSAQDRGLVFVKGTGFLLDGGRHSLRLAYSGVGTAEIEEGVSRLADAYRSLAPG